jgi:hypothetical protein
MKREQPQVPRLAPPELAPLQHVDGPPADLPRGASRTCSATSLGVGGNSNARPTASVTVMDRGK